jgi:UPF0716 family protein affecting phage T7 exclusion
VLTDLLALTLLVPYTRRLVASVVKTRVARAIERGSLHVVQTQQRAKQQFVIDTQGETVEEGQAAADEIPVRRLKP